MRWYALAQRPWIEEADGSGYWGLPPGTIGSVDLAAVGSQSHVFVTSDKPFDADDVATVIGDGTRLDSYVPTVDEQAAWEALVGVAVQPGWTLLDALWATLTAEADADGVTRAKPIMPTHRGVLELHLGGHSLVRAERLPADPATHPAWPNIQRVLQNDYRALQARDQTLARKWLGAQQLKYRLTPELARDLIVPADLPRVLPLKPTTTISDDFNRVDGPLGANWTERLGTWSISGNKATVSGNGSTIATHNTALSSDDHYAEVDIPGSNTNVVARGSTGPHYRARLGYDGVSANVLSIARYGSWTGSISTIFQDTFSQPSNTRIGIEVDGSSISVYSTERGKQTVTNTEVTAGTLTGMGQFWNGALLDNFEAADLLAETALVTVRSEAMATGEAPLPVRGRTRTRIEGLDVGQVAQRIRGIARRRDEAVALTEMSTVARALSRLRVEAVGISESTISMVEAVAEAVVRVLAEAVAMAEAVARPRRLARIRAELVGIAGAVARVGGFVSAAVPVITSRIRMRVGPSTRMNVPPARR